MLDPSIKILHMKMNPLHTAHQEYAEFQANKKRKLVSLNTEFISCVKSRCFSYDKVNLNFTFVAFFVGRIFVIFE